MRNFDFPHRLFLDRTGLAKHADLENNQLNPEPQQERRQEPLNDLTDLLMEQLTDIDVILPNEA